MQACAIAPELNAIEQVAHRVEADRRLLSCAIDTNDPGIAVLRVAPDEIAQIAIHQDDVKSGCFTKKFVEGIQVFLLETALLNKPAESWRQRSVSRRHPLDNHAKALARLDKPKNPRNGQVLAFARELACQIEIFLQLSTEHHIGAETPPFFEEEEPGLYLAVASFSLGGGLYGLDEDVRVHFVLEQISRGAVTGKPPLIEIYKIQDKLRHLYSIIKRARSNITSCLAFVI